MNVYELIFLACLQMNQGAACKQQMLDCVLTIRNQHVLTYTQKTDFKKQSADEFLNGQPQADWQSWVLDCAVKQLPKKVKYP